MGEFQSFIGVDFWTALFTLLNFLAVFFVGKRFLWGPVTKMVQERQKEIDDMYSEADTARASAKAMEEEKELLEFMQETLKGQVVDVRFSTSLVSYPVCLTSEGQITLEMERYFRGHCPGKEEGHQRCQG